MGNGITRWTNRTMVVPGFAQNGNNHDLHAEQNGHNGNLQQQHSPEGSGPARDFGFKRGEPMELDENAHQLVISVFSRVKSSQRLGESVLLRALRNRPDIKDMFGIAGIDDAEILKAPIIMKHAEKLGEFLRVAVHELHDVYAVDHIRKTGVLHIYFLKRDMSSDVWDHFKTALAESVVDLCPKQWRTEFKEIWFEVAEFMVWQMKDAYYDRVAREETKISIEPVFGSLMVGLDDALTTKKTL